MSVEKSFKNIAFTSLVKINGRQYEFNFRKPPGESMAYETDVTDARGDRIMFMMSFEDDQWRAHGALLPAWIEQHVALIGEAITTNK